MTIGLIGRKCGMTRIFNEDGSATPVTVIEVLPNRVTLKKAIETDGYNAIQVTTGSKKPSRINKALTGHYAKAKVEAGTGLWEFRTNEFQGLELGTELKVDIFTEGQMVDVAGVTKGKGFAGVVKRHNFSMQDATHGNSRSHRAPGSIGQNQTPGRVFKGKRMAGHMGATKRTIQNLKIVKIDIARNLILVKGAIPGAPGNGVIIKPAVKHEGGGK